MNKKVSGRKCLICHSVFKSSNPYPQPCKSCYNKIIQPPSLEEREELLKYFKYIRYCWKCGKAYGSDCIQEQDNLLCYSCNNRKYNFVVRKKKRRTISSVEQRI